MKAIPSFWRNTIWYVLLGATSIIELIVVFRKVKKRGQVVAFFLTIFGITLAVETTILIFMKSYSYYPLIFTKTGNPFDDALAGNLFSQFSISATVLMVVELKMKPYWYIIFTVIYALIEELFLALGIYSHNWYQTWMTVTTLPLGFLLAKIMYGKVLHGMKPYLYYGYILLALLSINIAIDFPLMLTGIHDMNYNVLADPIKSRHFIAVAMFFLMSASLMWAYFARLKLQWKAIVMIALFVLYFVGYKTNLFLMKDGWFLPVSVGTIFCMYFSVAMLDRLYGCPTRRE